MTDIFNKQANSDDRNTDCSLYSTLTRTNLDLHDDFKWPKSTAWFVVHTHNDLLQTTSPFRVISKLEIEIMNQSFQSIAICGRLSHPMSFRKERNLNNAQHGSVRPLPAGLARKLESILRTHAQRKSQHACAILTQRTRKWQAPIDLLFMATRHWAWLRSRFSLRIVLLKRTLKEIYTAHAQLPTILHGSRQEPPGRWNRPDFRHPASLRSATIR